MTRPSSTALHRVHGSSSLEWVPPLPIIVVPDGLLNLPLVELAQPGLHPEAWSVVIVDGDSSPDEARQRIQEVLHEASVPPGTEIVTIVIAPSLQAILGTGRRGQNQDQLVQLLERSDLRRRIADNNDLRQLLEMLGLMFLRNGSPEGRKLVLPSGSLSSRIPRDSQPFLRAKRILPVEHRIPSVS